MILEVAIDIDRRMEWNGDHEGSSYLAVNLVNLGLPTTGQINRYIGTIRGSHDMDWLMLVTHVGSNRIS